MRENNLIIICVTVILCIALIAGTFIIISTDNDNNPNVIENIVNPTGTGDNSNDQSQESGSSSSNTDKLDKINWATFYADGNPNTGEQVTVNVGSQHAGKVISLSMNYYRDGYTLIEEAPKSYTVNDEGNIYIPDTASMAKYPDKCSISITCDGYTTTATCNLEKRKGSQTVYFN